jgi:hypothetical protein
MGVETKERKRLILILDGFGMKRARRTSMRGGENRRKREKRLEKLERKRKYHKIILKSSYSNL